MNIAIKVAQHEHGVVGFSCIFTQLACLQGIGYGLDSPCECEHNNPDSLDARLFFTVVLAVAPAVTMDEASSLSWYLWSERKKLWPFRFVQGADMARVLRARLPITITVCECICICIYAYTHTRTQM